MIVVSDTSPICYLLLINQIEILPVLYNVVTIPQTVADELSASESPPVVSETLDGSSSQLASDPATQNFSRY